MPENDRPDSGCFEEDIQTDEITAVLAVLEAEAGVESGLAESAVLPAPEADPPETEPASDTTPPPAEPAPRLSGTSYGFSGSELKQHRNETVLPLARITLVRASEPDLARVSGSAEALIDELPPELADTLELTPEQLEAVHAAASTAADEADTETAVTQELTVRQPARLRHLPLITDQLEAALEAAYSVDDLPDAMVDLLEIEPADPPEPADSPEPTGSSWLHRVPLLRPPPTFPLDRPWELLPAAPADPQGWLAGLPKAPLSAARTVDPAAVLAELEAKYGPTDAPAPRYDTFIDEFGDEVILLDESDIIEWRIVFRPIGMPPLPADAGR